MCDVWEEFVVKQSTEEAKAKDEKFFELAKRNELHHHLGMIGYAAKMEKCRQEEREAAEARQPNPPADEEEAIPPNHTKSSWPTSTHTQVCLKGMLLASIVNL